MHCARLCFGWGAQRVEDIVEVFDRTFGGPGGVKEASLEEVHLPLSLDV